MPSTFSSWASSENARPTAINGEADDSANQPVVTGSVPSSFVVAADASIDELKETLAVARRRLQYFEGFAPWIEEQMAAVVEHAAHVAGDSDREQERLAAEIERQRAQMDHLAGERERLQLEAKAVVDEANARAERVVDEANATASRLLAEAHRNAETLVNRLREDASAIVSRAVGDLVALEQTNAAAQHQAPPLAAVSAWEMANENAHSSEPQTEGSASNPDDLWTGPASADGGSSASNHDEPRDSDSLEIGPGTEGEPEPAADGQAHDQSGVEEPAEPGPFQWLRTALTGRDAAPGNGASADGTADPTPSGAVFPPGEAEMPAPPAAQTSDEVFITRLTVHPAFSPEERTRLRGAIERLTGVEQVGIGSVTEDFFELLITHQLFTSMLGSLLSAAGEHIRLIAQHDDSLEVEVTSLEWANAEQDAAEVGRGADA